MIVRIRLSTGARVAQRQRKNKHIALAFASLLTPGSVVLCVLAFWRLTADFKVTSEFFITSGFFSHWQVWLAMSAIIQLFSIFLNRYGNAEPVFRKPVDGPPNNLADSRS